MLQGRYDVHLLLEELQRRGEKPRRFVSNGLRVYVMEMGGNRKRQLVCKDTLNFFGCPLAALPATFGLQERCRDKPYFPYAYCRRENMDVERADGLPPVEAYEPDGMRPEERAAFLRWHAEQRQQHPPRPFLLRRELLRYCANGMDGGGAGNCASASAASPF